MDGRARRVRRARADARASQAVDAAVDARPRGRRARRRRCRREPRHVDDPALRPRRRRHRRPRRCPSRPCAFPVEAACSSVRRSVRARPCGSSTPTARAGCSGRYRDGAWSPHARFVVATAGRRLVAIDPHTGKLHWSHTAPAVVRGARWSLEPTVPPCCRIAYLTVGARSNDGTLRVIAGDGSGDHAVAPADPRVAPAWRPGDRQRASPTSIPPVPCAS